MAILERLLVDEVLLDEFCNRWKIVKLDVVQTITAMREKLVWQVIERIRLQTIVRHV